MPFKVLGEGKSCLGGRAPLAESQTAKRCVTEGNNSQFIHNSFSGHRKL